MFNMINSHQGCNKGLPFKPEFSNLVAYKGFGKLQKLQHFS